MDDCLGDVTEKIVPKLQEQQTDEYWRSRIGIRRLLFLFDPSEPTGTGIARPSTSSWIVPLAVVVSVVVLLLIVIALFVLHRRRPYSRTMEKGGWELHAPAQYSNLSKNELFKVQLNSVLIFLRFIRKQFFLCV